MLFSCGPLEGRSPSDLNTSSASSGDVVLTNQKPAASTNCKVCKAKTHCSCLVYKAQYSYNTSGGCIQIANKNEMVLALLP